MFGLVSKVLNFLWNAVVAYAASEQGGADLRGILDEAEADGIDIPFYEPSGQTGEAGDVGDVGTTEAEFVQPARNAPRLIKKDVQP